MSFAPILLMIFGIAIIIAGFVTKNSDGSFIKPYNEDKDRETIEKVGNILITVGTIIFIAFLLLYIFFK